jgi:hypothetical protein
VFITILTAGLFLPMWIIYQWIVLPLTPYRCQLCWQGKADVNCVRFSPNHADLPATVAGFYVACMELYLWTGINFMCTSLREWITVSC